ncbi:tetratricopeptide repeat protein [Chitinophaga qingshengii]|uniref:Tetratricopeptide repeat protein n=1 Tax=Chitinophaga qingshengii TaxID=1569794 RepID=A0ABR7TRQ2_9BACT|nr:tetratricopeptide repeat protein [Chitinophaga qingshengii]MBC9933171.1 tetratricopeptide repeat protein [Chitinophaga qingshengii]
MRTSVLKYVFLSFATAATLQTMAQSGRKGKAAEALYDDAVKATRAKQYTAAIRLSRQALATEPDFVDQQLLLGRLYLLTNQYDSARKYIRQVLTTAPRYRDAYLYAINVELAQQQYEEAECYADMALGYFNGDRDLMLKKLSVMDEARKFYQGSNYANSLLDRYGSDTVVQKASTGHFLLAGAYFRKNGYNSLARSNYEKALMIDPSNPEARQALTGMDIRDNNYRAALERVEAELATHPGSYELQMSKLSLLQEMHRYPEAISQLEAITKRFPADAKARSQQVPLRMEAAAYYTNTDPYALYQSILEKNPGNQEALQKLIGLSVSRGAYREALNWINAGLKSHPDDTRLLSLKADMLESDRKFAEAAMLAEKLLQRQPGNATERERLVRLYIASGRDYLVQQQYPEALTAFESALRIAPADTTASDLLANTYLLQKKPAQAVTVLDQALRQHPDNARLLLKKANILADMGQYDAASAIMETLLQRYPVNEQYHALYQDIHLSAGRILMQHEEYEQAKEQFQAVLARDPHQPEALQYLINAESAMQQPDSALARIDQALQQDPHNRELLFKKAGILSTQHQYAAAGNILDSLRQQYPFTLKYRNAYTDNLLAAGIDAQRNQQPDSALQVFRQVLSINRKDSAALLYSINLYNGKGNYDSALAYADQGLRYYPDNATFLEKRVVTLENKKDYNAASLAADSLLKRSNTATTSDYADYLRSKTLKNQFGLFFLRSSYDYGTSRWYNIATAEYRHFMKRGSYAARLNYGGREEGTGVMGEAELYYTHTRRTYSYALAGYANSAVFPTARLAYSIFHTFGKSFEAELGGRYLKADSLNIYSGVVSVANRFSDFYVNLRAYFISDQPHFYTSFNLTTRYYMNRDQDYLLLVAALGTSPDDRSRLVQFPQLAGLLTRSVGAGYQKTFRYRTTLGLYGTWINQKVSPTLFQNQYDIFVTIQRKF